jgi:hypothetical protein
MHSVESTLLLDDSPLKAVLQPYNHLCIREYDRAMRVRDLRVLEQDGAVAAAAAAARKEREAAETRGAPDEGLLPPGLNEGGAGGNSKKTKRSKKAKKGQKEAAQASRVDGEARIRDPVEAGGYDRTLLAVVGVLDAIKGESNVASWIRAGGLWAVGKPEEGVDSCASSDEGVGPAKKKRRVSGEVAVAVSDAGNDATENAPTPTKMWFEDEATLKYWTTRGLRALDELGIEPERGLQYTGEPSFLS